MTTPAKQYQNVSFKELISYSENNPNRNKKLDSIEIHSAKPSQETSLDKLGLNGYTSINLNPSGVISVIACINDPGYYSLAANNARTQLIIDLATSLQEKTDELKNTSLSRKRKKIYDLLGSAYNGSILEEKDYLDLFSALSTLCNLQFVLMKSAVQDNIEEGKQYESSLKGEIVFATDPTNWKLDIPVWIVDFRARWVAIPSESNAKSIHTILGSWLSYIEQNGWVIRWTEVDGTKTEIVEKLSSMPTWNINDKKLSKELLAARLGRANCIRTFTNWITSQANLNM
jgi:hypothetical protein